MAKHMGDNYSLSDQKTNDSAIYSTVQICMVLASEIEHKLKVNFDDTNTFF